MALKQQLKYGFWIAFAYFIWWTIEKFAGLHADQIAQRSLATLLSCSIPLVGIFIAIRRLKKEFYQNASTGELAIQGGIVLVMSAILCLILAAIFYQWVSPEYTPNKVEYVLAQIQKNNPEIDISAKREMAEASFSTMSMAISHFSWLIMSGLIFLLPQAFIAKKIK